MVRKKKAGRKKKFESITEKTEPIKMEKISKFTELGEKKRREFIKEREGFPLFYPVLIVIVVAVIGALLFMITLSVPASMNPVKEGDIAQIMYTGRLANGTIFDSGNFTFRVGAGEAISGVDQAVTGMRIGEKKTSTIPPEQAYGYYDPSRILSIPLVQELERIDNITIEVFKLSFEEDPALNRMYQIEGMQWPVRVIEMQNQTVVIKHEPEDGMVYDLKDGVGEVYGTARVSVGWDKITVTTYPVEGSVVITVMGAGRITEVNETHMMMDLNHELAGETLTFEITLLNFMSY
ncbi:MAG: FKBP-type peptidyl-prolyl cis-trans isomerase [Candidatus Aenigmarchaeota archaeon]